MKKLIALFALILCIVMLTSCTNTQIINVKLQNSQMRAICELATMECYYHNVAKYEESNIPVGLFGWGRGYKEFWIEYSGKATVVVDASQLKMKVNGEKVEITIPPASVSECVVEELNTESFIIANGSIQPSAADQVMAMSEAQKDMKETASNDTAMLLNAQQRAKELLEDYVENIGSVTGIDYQIEWILLEGAADAM